MITRPLDLATRLRPAPQSFDWVFYVNAGLIVLFFSLFGSRFVLAPGLGLNFRLPTMDGASAGAVRTTHRIIVLGAELVYVNEGSMNAKQLREWLAREARKTKSPTLLMVVAAPVPTKVSIDIAQAALNLGWQVQWALQESAARSGEGR